MRKANVMVLSSITLIALVAATVGAGTFAHFYDVETGVGLFQSGYVDLRIKYGGQWYDDDPGNPGLPNVADLPDFTGMAPGEESSEVDIRFKNFGNVAGVVNVDFSYSESDASPNYEDVGPNAYAKKVLVSYAALDDGPNIAYYWALQIKQENYATWADAEADGAVYKDGSDWRPTIYGMTKITVSPLDAGYGSDKTLFDEGESFDEQVKLKLAPDVPNSYQNDGISITITATLTTDTT